MGSQASSEHERHTSSETRKRILAAAEKLFAAKGFEATSVRDITTEADCNVASVNYHFGGKESLFQEAFRTLLAEINERRIGAIQRDMEADQEMTLEGFLQSFANAFLEPLVDESRGRLFMAFFAREMMDPHLPQDMIVKEFIQPFLTVATAALERLGPPMPSRTRAQCIMSLVGQLLQILHARRLAASSKNHVLGSYSLEDYIQHIVRFTVGGIRELAATNAEKVQENPT
jgi:AcrR family transcriptional regulator